MKKIFLQNSKNMKKKDKNAGICVKVTKNEF